MHNLLKKKYKENDFTKNIFKHAILYTEQKYKRTTLSIGIILSIS